MNETITKENFYFDCSVNFCGEPFNQSIKAETASKARYRFYQNNFDEESYAEMFKFIKVKKIGKCNPHDLDEIDEYELEKFNRIKEYRQISFAYIGMKIKVENDFGKIVGGNSSANLNVDFGNDNVQNCHPHWKTTYYDKNDNIIKEF